MATPERGLGSHDVHVKITINQADGEIKVIPDPFHISKKNDQEVVFECEDPYFTVEFNKANHSPFHGVLFTRQSPCSGLAVVTPDSKKVYEYTVEAFGKKVDPGGVVDQ